MTLSLSITFDNFTISDSYILAKAFSYQQNTILHPFEVVEETVYWDSFFFLFWPPEQILLEFIDKLNMHNIQLYIQHLQDAFKCLHSNQF